MCLGMPFSPRQGGEERPSSGWGSPAENLLSLRCLVFHHHGFTLKLTKLISFAKDISFARDRKTSDVFWENSMNGKELRVLKNNEMKRMAESQPLVILYHRPFTILVFYLGGKPHVSK